MTRVGVIGTGYLGRLHARVLTEMPEAEVVGFVEPKDENAAEVESKLKLKRFESLDAIANEIDCAVIATPTVTHFEIAQQLINAACGFDWSIEDMMRCGERGWNLKRAINNRMGLTRANDKLPKAMLEPFPDGGSGGYVPDFEGMLSTYYQAREWDPQAGKPTREKLMDLGLDDIIKDLWGVDS